MMPIGQIKLVAAIAVGSGLFVAGWITHGWKVDAGRLRDEQIIQQAELGAAKAIAKITVSNTTIKQTLEREIRENPIYFGCNHSPDGLRLINAALVGARGGELPTSSAPE